MKTMPAIAIVLWAFTGIDHQAEASSRELPWCVSADGREDCTYYAFRQCLAMARGFGSCSRNPRFDSYYFERGLPAPVDVNSFPRPLPQRRR
jgi:hypothetical protein